MKYLLLLLLITGKMTLQAQDLKPFKNDDNKWGYKDAKGNEVIAPKYAHAKEFSEGMAAVKLLGKWGYIDTTAKLIIPYQYSTANPFRKGKAIVSEIDISGNVRFFSIDKTGTEIKYNEAEGGE